MYFVEYEIRLRFKSYALKLKIGLHGGVCISSVWELNRAKIDLRKKGERKYRRENVFDTKIEMLFVDNWFSQIEF